MAGGGSEGEELKGLSKYFNSTTITGRANTTRATYAALALVGLYFYFKPKKTAQPSK